MESIVRSGNSNQLLELATSHKFSDLKMISN